MGGAHDSGKNSKRVVGRPFKPGQSGNPGGRHKQTPEIKAIFSLENAARVADQLLATALNGKSKLHVKAAQIFLERVLGKVPLRIADADGKRFGLREAPRDEKALIDAVAEIIARKSQEQQRADS